MPIGLAGVMRRRTKWIVAGGAAAFVLTPVAGVYSSTAWDAELPQTGVVLDAEVANQARLRQASTKPTPSPTATASTKAKAEPTGKKTVSAATPISPKTAPTANTPTSPNSPNSPG